MIAKRYLLATVLFCGAAFSAEPNFPPFDIGQTRRIPEQEARSSVQAEATFGSTARLSSTAAALPVWTYSIKAAQDGRTYSGQIVGQNPATSGTTTTVPVVMVPVIFRIVQGGTTYSFDPTSRDSGCLGGANTAYGLLADSPIFQNTSFTFAGTSIGTMQYEDAFVHGEFWKVAQKSYHLKLAPSASPALTITINAGSQGNSTATIYSAGAQCGYNTGGLNPPGALAVVNINSVDAVLQAYIQKYGLNASQFPFFLTYNAVLSQGAANNLNNCCVLGYHNALSSGQTYGIAEFEGRNQTVFQGVSDVAPASHEINEWVNDPMGTNPAPSWGNVGQQQGSCQANFEVGDPLTGSLLPAIASSVGFTYHLQELAYFSWFYGGAPLGAGGVYSNNGTFAGAAMLCPPGGTN